jgi:protease-4
MPLEKVREVAKGRVWTGADAKDRGLVDEFGSFRAALTEAKKLAGMKPEDTVNLHRFPSRMTPYEAIAEMFGTSSSMVRTMALLGEVLDNPQIREMLSVVREDTQATGTQLRSLRQKVE